MKFKSESDRQLVIRSVLLLSKGDEELAAKAVDLSNSLDDAIRYIFCKLGEEKFCIMHYDNK